MEMDESSERMAKDEARSGGRSGRNPSAGRAAWASLDISIHRPKPPLETILFQ